MKGAIIRPLSGPVRKLHSHVIDGFVVTSTLSPADLAALDERRRVGLLRRILRTCPNPQRA